MAVTINGTTGIAGVDGSAGTPAVRGSDTNTGIFFPAADTIAFGEGGAEVMRITSAGNLQLTSAASTVVNSSGTPILQQTGSVLQVVQATTSTQVVVASTTYADTGLSATITPTSATSKILVLVNQQAALTRDSTGNGGGIRILRGATTIFAPLENGVTGSAPIEFYNQATGATVVRTYTRMSINYLDSPATNQAVTYKTQGAVYNATNVSSITFQSAAAPSVATSTIILMEIAG